MTRPSADRSQPRWSGAPELLGVDLATIHEAAAHVEPYVRVDGTKVWSLMLFRSLVVASVLAGLIGVANRGNSGRL
jgi:hypothetical protein